MCGGGGGHQHPAKMEKPGGVEGPKLNSRYGGGRGIFWNFTFLAGNEFKQEPFTTNIKCHSILSKEA